MTEYKFVNRKTFGKEALFLDDINNEAKKGWRAVSFGYTKSGRVMKAVLERIK